MMKTALPALAILLSSTSFAQNCQKQAIDGFEYQKSEKFADHYVNKQLNLSLSLDCSQSPSGLSTSIEALKKEFQVLRLDENTHFYDFTKNGVATRNFLIKKGNSLALAAFVTRTANSAALEQTTQIIRQIKLP